METWGVWDWIGYVTLWIVAVSQAVDGALSNNKYAQRLTPPLFRSRAAKVAPVALLAIGFGAFLVARSEQTIDFDDVSQEWGQAPSLEVTYLKIDGSKLSYYADKSYRIMAVTFNYNGRIDEDQVTDICKSSLYEIQNGVQTILVPWSAQFKDELLGPHGETLIYGLAVPKNVEPDEFENLSQAELLGVKILGHVGVR